MTLAAIYAAFIPARLGFCIAVETHCGFMISREEIGRIAGRAATAEEFERIWRDSDWWFE